MGTHHLPSPSLLRDAGVPAVSLSAGLVSVLLHPARSSTAAINPAPPRPMTQPSLKAWFQIPDPGLRRNAVFGPPPRSEVQPEAGNPLQEKQWLCHFFPQSSPSNPGDRNNR
jgi:hypothetical protein